MHGRSTPACRALTCCTARPDSPLGPRLDRFHLLLAREKRILDLQISFGLFLTIKRSPMGFTSCPSKRNAKRVLYEGSLDRMPSHHLRCLDSLTAPPQCCSAKVSVLPTISTTLETRSQSHSMRKLIAADPITSWPQ